MFFRFSQANQNTQLIFHLTLHDEPLSSFNPLSFEDLLLIPAQYRHDDHRNLLKKLKNSFQFISIFLYFYQVLSQIL